mmetsp:Transcript_30352/g.72766  ORF Transcript_30352/g.72766 Transcript_30352/m.72766 type:complete len:248 (+) Transcript_30352:660-1403(+)
MALVPTGTQCARCTTHWSWVSAMLGSPGRSHWRISPHENEYQCRRQWSTCPTRQRSTSPSRNLPLLGCPPFHHPQPAAESAFDPRTQVASRRPSCTPASGRPAASCTSNRKQDLGRQSCTSVHHCTGIGTAASRTEWHISGSGSPTSFDPRKCPSGNTSCTGGARTARDNRQADPRPALGIGFGNLVGGTWARSPARRRAVCNSRCSVASSSCAPHSEQSARAGRKPSAGRAIHDHHPCSQSPWLLW